MTDLRQLQIEYERITRKQNQTKQVLGRRIAKEHLWQNKENAQIILELLNRGAQLKQEWTPQTGFQWLLFHSTFRAVYDGSNYSAFLPFELEDALQVLGLITKDIEIESKTYKQYNIYITDVGKEWLKSIDKMYWYE